MRLTEYIDFLNRKDLIDTNYSHLKITEALKRVRKKHRKSIREPLNIS